MVACWHVAQTENGMLAEQTIFKLGFPTFYPRTRTEINYSRGRKRVRIAPYITGYIFIRFDPVEDEWEPIQWARGVRTVPGWPAKVREHQLIPLLGLVGRNGFIDEAEADRVLFDFKVGDNVKVPIGPFAGFVGPVVGVEDKRLSVLLEIFGRKTEVRVDKKLAYPIA